MKKATGKVAFFENKFQQAVYSPFFDRRVPAVAPWRALNFGFDLQIT